MKSGEFRPQEKTYAGHKVTTGVIYAHPEKVYVEHDCVEVSNERSAGLLRLWDFSTPAIPTKFASEEYRSEIAGREQTVLSYLIDRNPEVERMTLRPRAGTHKGDSVGDGAVIQGLRRENEDGSGLFLAERRTVLAT
jgi:hypothetical protein